jgi:hypothetical protein
MPRKRSPFNQVDEKRGGVTAVQFQEGLWCYVRQYVLCHGFLPFFSRIPLSTESLPTLQAAMFFDLWCYDSDETPMVFIGRFPFDRDEESYGEPCYTAPDVIDACYKIHEMPQGAYLIRRTQDASEVTGMRLQRRYQPAEFHVLLAEKVGTWPILEDHGQQSS